MLWYIFGISILLPGVVNVFFVITPEDTLAMLGDSAQLNCSFNEKNGYAAWYKGEPGKDQKAITLGNIIVDDNPQYEVLGGEDGDYHIRIRNVDMTSEDYYECGDQIVTGRRVSAHVYVISSVPVCSIKPSYIVRAGEHVTLNCSIDLNKNAPGELVWFKNGIEIQRKGVHQSAITMRVDKSDHEATYDCGLQHFTLPSWKWSNLICQEKIVMAVKYTPDYIETTKTTYEVPVGDVVNLSCTANGFPKPNISWFDHYGDVIPGNEIYRNINTHIDNETRVTSILEITVLDESYNGIYYCQAFNEMGYSGKLTFNILVQGRPIEFIVVIVGAAVVIFTAIIVGVCLWRRHLKKTPEKNDGCYMKTTVIDRFTGTTSPLMTGKPRGIRRGLTL